MRCYECKYLSSAEIAEGGKMHTCDAHILEDGNGHPMMSIYVTHDWCPYMEKVKQMYEKFVPLVGAYNGTYGALFCRKCHNFLCCEDSIDPSLNHCLKCGAKIDYQHKIKLVKGKWEKVEE